MTAREQSILNRLNADNYALLYRCRWSESHAKVVVPKLIKLLASTESEIVDEALRGLFRIGTPAVDAARDVAALTESEARITRQLAVLTLGQIAHHRPKLCVKPIAAALSDEVCCQDALRILDYIGAPAKSALESIVNLYSSPDAKTRKAVVTAAAAIGKNSEDTKQLLKAASKDHSKPVRDAAKKACK